VNSRKGIVRTLLVSLPTLLLAATASPALADKPDQNRPVQLALGDSWAAGVGASAPSEGYVPQLNEALKEDFNCHGSAPAQSSSGCKHLLLVNVGVGGATTPTMVANQFPQAIPLLQSRNGNNKQNDDVEVVTISIGGNDVTNPIIAACLIGGLTPTCVATIQAELAAYRSDLDGALSTLRDAAGPDAPIVIGTYDNPFRFPTCNIGAAFPQSALLGELVLEGGLPGVVPNGLHDIMRDVGADHGVLVAEVHGDLIAADWVGGADCLHPRDSGYDKVTLAFLEALGL
jgi:lysophospholipase L1-like esterase